MPVQLADTNTQITYTMADQAWIIAPGVKAGAGVLSSQAGSILVNHGSILNVGQGAAFFDPDVLFRNHAGALVSGSSGVVVNADQAALQNEGSIFGYVSYGIYAANTANHVSITNSGIVSAPIAGILFGTSSLVVASLTNSGVISSEEHGVRVQSAGAPPSIINSGTISGTVNSIIALGDERLLVTNSGSLVGNVGGGTASDSVTNNGAISGNVLLGSGIDAYTGTGTVSGSIFGEDGDDSLSGGSSVDRLHGGNGVDVLIGNAGNDVLSGGLGADTLNGGAGNDTYAMENGADSIVDAAGIDTITSTISRSLASYAAVERLTLAGAAVSNGTGNNLANLITGNTAANVLNGGLGNDVLYGVGGNDQLVGGLGRDTLTGGLNNDFFVFNTGPNTATNRDTITDFANIAGNNDTFRLENAVFAKLGGAGVLNAQFLRLGAAALDANDYVVYNKATGVLTYDLNGNAAGGAQQIAFLANKPTLTLGDFVVI